MEYKYLPQYQYGGGQGRFMVDANESLVTPVIDPQYLQSHIDKWNNRFEMGMQLPVQLQQLYNETNIASNLEDPVRGIIDKTVSDINNAVTDKFNGDWGVAAPYMTSMIEKGRSAIATGKKAYEEDMKLKEIQQRLGNKAVIDYYMKKGATEEQAAQYARGEMNSHIYDEQSGRIIRNPAVANIIEKSDYDKYINDRYANSINNSVRSLGLSEFQIDGLSNMYTTGKVKGMDDDQAKSYLNKIIDDDRLKYFINENKSFLPEYLDKPSTLEYKDLTEEDKIKAKSYMLKAAQDLTYKQKDVDYRQFSKGEGDEDDYHGVDLAPVGTLGVGGEGSVISNISDFRYALNSDNDWLRSIGENLSNIGGRKYLEENNITGYENPNDYYEDVKNNFRNRQIEILRKYGVEGTGEIQKQANGTFVISHGYSGMSSANTPVQSLTYLTEKEINDLKKYYNIIRGYEKKIEDEIEIMKREGKTIKALDFEYFDYTDGDIAKKAANLLDEYENVVSYGSFDFIVTPKGKEWLKNKGKTKEANNEFNKLRKDLNIGGIGGDFDKGVIFRLTDGNESYIVDIKNDDVKYQMMKHFGKSGEKYVKMQAIADGKKFFSGKKTFNLGKDSLSLPELKKLVTEKIQNPTLTDMLSVIPNEHVQMAMVLYANQVAVDTGIKDIFNLPYEEAIKILAINNR